MSYQKKKGGYLLRIGSRQSSKHLRIYQKRNGLEFELEIKKQETKKLQSFLFSNQLETFEDSSIRCYYEYLWNYLVFENPFTEWLVVGGRKLRMNRFLSDSLALSYLKPNLARDIYQSFDKKPETLCFIQLLSFLDQRKDKIQILERSLGFVKIHFQAEDFFNQTFDQIKENVYIFNKEVNFLCQKKKKICLLGLYLVFSIIWVIHPISYDEMRSRHPIYPQEIIEKVDSSFISTENDEFYALKNNGVILAKDTSGSGSLFAEGLTPALPRHRGTSQLGGAGSPNPGSSSGSNPNSNSNPSSKNGNSLSPRISSVNSTQIPKDVPGSQYLLGKKKKPSSETIGGFEFTLDKNRNPVLIVKNENGSRSFVEYDQVLNKYYHNNVFGLKGPKNFDADYARSLPLKEKLEYLEKTVPKKDVIKMQIEIAKSLSNENLKEVPGFIGKRKDPGTVKINQKTGQVHFLDDRTNRWRTAVRKSQSGLKKFAQNGFHLFPNAGTN